MKLADLKIDEDFRTLLPELDAESYTELERLIVKDGVREPITIWNGYIADGHNRYKICKAHKILEVEVSVLDREKKSEVMEWILENQKARRNLPLIDLVALYSKYEEQYRKEAKQRQADNMRNNQKQNLQKSSNLNESEKQEEIRTAAKVAEKLNISENTYRDLKLINEKGSEEKKERARKGGRGNSTSALAKEIKEGIPDGYRKCRKCGEVKPLDEFWKRDKSSGIYETICICCRNKKKKEGASKDVSATVLTEDQKGTRKCSRCGQIKPISLFSINHGCKTFVCKKCDVERKKEAEKSKVMPDTLNPNIPVVITEDVTISEFENILANTINSFEIALDINKEHITKDVKSAINKLIDEHIKKMEKIKESI